ncbi:MAG: hypothetical protein US42_C0010G0030 [Candidatus Magasanikbacteria bacterium GW2011_GWC2_37_14]|uniref:Uncharacterized protein n=1 Tax=Candidatus Magasanikbacteria bacterium GW2011_GWC2_37_14 TaxID=1619046 RepID=A0A0G0G8H2_9BACT|nr:MAG: hypothetical protein US42_C0010G0030 [Candidatus Magasanikbacteria bacterium GW2011_GWC2_37_14]
MVNTPNPNDPDIQEALRLAKEVAERPETKDDRNHNTITAAHIAETKKRLGLEQDATDTLADLEK